MKKVYGIENLNCSHCAAKIENQIKNLNEVKECNINLYKKKLTIEVSDDINLDNFFNVISEIADKIEKGTEIGRAHV